MIPLRQPLPVKIRGLNATYRDLSGPVTPAVGIFTRTADFRDAAIPTA